MVAALENTVVGVVDELTRGGMAVFRSSAIAIRTLTLSIEGRLYVEQLREGCGRIPS